MSTQMVFKRYELKYLLTIKEYLELKELMKQYMKLDQFGKHSIHNFYFDTSDFLLIRRSLEKPCYKEKLRVRSYGNQKGDNMEPKGENKFSPLASVISPLQASEITGLNNEKVFVELKKKYDGVVYKRRLELPTKEAFDFLIDDISPDGETQITKEIKYFMAYYKNLKPMIYLSYEREAFYGIENPDFRMTFDHNIRMKECDTKEKKEAKIMEDDRVLLEVKTGMGIPAWLVHFFSENKIYKTSFSKYGRAYEKFLLPKYMKSMDSIKLSIPEKETTQKLNNQHRRGEIYVA